MEISPDQIVYFHLGPVAINATILFTWVVMLLLVWAGSGVDAYFLSAKLLRENRHPVRYEAAKIAARKKAPGDLPSPPTPKLGA